MIPVLWLTGPPGVGKTAVAWDLFCRMQAGGADPAYVDVDQLGICYPPPEGDLERHALKARNVAALRANFAVAGARGLIVSGVVDPRRGPDVETLGGGAVAVVRLLADEDELRGRLVRREGVAAQTGAAVDEARTYERSNFTGLRLDTSALSVVEAAMRLLAMIGDWPPAASQQPPLAPGAAQPAAGGEVLWISGPAAVGKSTIGFRAYLDVLNSGRRAAYVDAGQLGFFGSRGDHALKARNLAAVWRNFHAIGARAAVITGRIATAAEASLYESALPHVRFTWRALAVGEAELARRMLSRRGGGSWAEPGDALQGRPEAELRELAAHIAKRGDHHGQLLDIDGLTVEAAATAILRASKWPAGPPPVDRPAGAS